MSIDIKRGTNITRKSLGRAATFGSFYDATRDTFCGTSFLNVNSFKDVISQVDIHHSELSAEYEDSFKEKFEKLGVEDELRLSLLTGLVELVSSGKYLCDVKKTFKSIKGTLLYKLTSVSEHLNIYRDDVKASISIDGLPHPEATHVVIGIKWGATIMASFEYKKTNDENRSHVERILKDQLSQIISKGLDVKDGEHNINLFSIKIFGDIVSENNEFPQSFAEAKKIIAELPSRMKQYNNGKGVPVEYTLIPLSELANILNYKIAINKMIKVIKEDTIIRAVQIFDNLSKSKQKLRDLWQCADSISDQISNDVYDEIDKYAQQVKKKEASYMHELRECLIEVRSGITDISILESKIEQLRNSISPIMAFVNKHQSIFIKLELISVLKANKVEYIENNGTIEDILYKYPKGHIYILLDNNDNIINNEISPVYTMFRDLPMLYMINKYFIANLEKCSRIKNPGRTVIHHYIDEKLASDDYYSAKKNLFESNLIKFDSMPRRNFTCSGEKIRLFLPCPRTDCSVDCYWKCYRCESEVEYSYNRYLYCGCGESNITDAKFKCNNPYHNEGFISYEKTAIYQMLPEKPPEEINLLLLGETGVGKSTFINAFVNYLRYETFEEAKSGDLVALISSKFSITDEDYNTKEVRIGDDDSNEQFDIVGASATQGCKSHVFHIDENKILRLIDTPGIGDTRGLDQDKRNFDNILKCLSFHKHLNGICILLKPNDSRTTIVFRFCIQELLTHLHKSAKDNIVFCFTNARGTFYRPGDTLPPLKEHLKKLQDRSNVEIKIKRDTMYCFDSESFKFLAALKGKIKFPKEEEESFAESWKRSVNETMRLLEYISKCPPHNIKETLSLNESRNIVIILAKPLAQTTQNIETNIKLIKEHQTEIKNTNETMEQLQKKLHIPQADLEPEGLPFPRTVCTSNGCVKSIQIEQLNIYKTDYITHCHSHCYLSDVTTDLVNNVALKECVTINSSGYCNHCGCHWSKHMHIRYENKTVMKNFLDPKINKQIYENKTDQERKQAMLEQCEARRQQLEKEKEKIEEINLKFARFLRENAITPFNDAYVDYLELFIAEEKRLKNENPYYNNELLERLEQTRNIYLKNIEVIQKSIQTKNPSLPSLLPEDIAQLEQQLYNLPINGETLRKIKQEAERGKNNAFKYHENHIRATRKSNQVYHSLQQVFSKMNECRQQVFSKVNEFVVKNF
ncbi:12020_t:CDS:1 [Ambispora leptoticha]|uniref:12020_t:CDS:1 n=1 Tax=Ambispora leptoticha TaxID=144679 RepID=A0A9N8VYU4_9GLOM|nr:12020_t:CDS:1 [Ambispora leptoticha]